MRTTRATQLPTRTRTQTQAQIPTSSVPRSILAAGLLALLAGGCTVDNIVARAGVPGTTLDAQVSDVATRGGYIDAHVVAGGFDYRFFFPNSEPCRTLLEGTEPVRFQWLSLLGRITGGDLRCDAVGVLSLRRWRNRQPRGAREPLERAQARYEVLYTDDDMVQLIGRFPLAGRLGFTGTGQIVAVVPNDEACQAPISGRTASMEFRASGPRPLVLIAGRQLCEVIGLAQPRPRTSAEPSDAAISPSPEP
jgi:hypothetical protein